MQRNTLQSTTINLCLTLGLWLTFGANVNGAEIEAPQVFLRGIDYTITVTGDDATTAVLTTEANTYHQEPDGDG